jgi:hypothetical protein
MCRIVHLILLCIIFPDVPPLAVAQATPVAAASTVVSCLAPAALLDANRAATITGRVPVGTLSTRYAYSGQGLTGEISTTTDFTSGFFVETEVIGPTREASGFDGHLAWMKDMSGAYLPQQGGDEPALAANQAYRNSNAWWQTDRLGAEVESIGCNGIRVTPNGGKPFDAWFDSASHLLIRIREVKSFGGVAETRYSTFARRGNEQVPTIIEIQTNDNPKDPQTLRLTDFVITAAQPASSYAMPHVAPTDWSLPSGKMTVPFRLLNNHVIVDARVNGRGPFPFLVDTGGHDIITSSTAASLDLQPEGKSQSTGAGDKTATSGYIAIQKLEVGDAALTHQIVLDLDFSPPDVEGIQLGGMIGVEFFERFVVQIDYGARTLTLIDPAHFGSVDRADAGTPVPFTFYSHMPQVEGRFDGRRALLNIDTGSRAEVTLTAPFVASAGLLKSYPNGIAITDGWGVGGPSHSYVIRASEIDLGTVKVFRPIAGLSSAQHGAFSDANYQGNVGSGLLKRFVATFDYESETLYLKPAADQDPDIGESDRVGLWLNAASGGLKIMDLAPGGPGEEAGLKVGDLVTAIDGTSVLDSSLSEVRRSLKLLRVGVPITIIARRNGEIQNATVIPRDLIPR